MHVSAPGRSFEISRLGTRAVDDPTGDGPGTFDSPVDRIGSAASRLVATGRSSAADPSSAPHDLSRARGPPIA
jgi:hypothetical protein